MLMIVSIGTLSGCTNIEDKANMDWQVVVKGYKVNPVCGGGPIEKGGSLKIDIWVYSNHKQDFRLNQKQTSSNCWVQCPQSFSNYVGNVFYSQYQITITISTSNYANKETVYLEYVPI